MPNVTKAPLKLMLLEDNAADADLVSEYIELSNLSCEILVASRLAEGIKILQEVSFDVVLLDLSLPDSNGIDTLTAVQKIAGSEVIIVLTGADDEALSLSALQSGAQDYLFKDTLSSEVLSRSIRYSLERANLLKRLEVHNRETEYREALLRRIFDANTDAMLILTDECEIKFLNPAAGYLLDAKPNSLIGEIFPFDVRGGQRTELEIPGEANSFRLVELKAVELVWEGESSMLVVLRDISEHREAEVSLQHERDRLDVIIDSIADSVIATDSDGRVERINAEAARMIGIEKETAQGQALGEVLSLEDTESAKPIEDLGLLLTERGEEDSVEYRLVPKSGEPVLVHAAMRTISANDGVTCGEVFIFRNVTRSKEPEDGLFQNEKLQSISQLAGGIAHDFNNILTAVLGNISVARMGLGENHAESEKLHLAEKAALQAKTLTQQLLTFSKGGTPLLEATTLDQLVEDCAQFILRGSNVRCELEKDADLWPVDADKGQIGQVVNNLVINADQSMASGGILRISLSNLRNDRKQVQRLAAGDYVAIAVQDEGMGIPPDNLKRIFDPYFTTKEDGNGLGLASSYSIVQNHKGSIIVDSVVGAGSTFTVFLPKSATAETAEDVEANTPDDEEETVHSGNGSILVMDDMEAMLMVAGEIIGMLGYEVTLTSDGEEAIEAYKAAKESGEPFSAVVFDLTVPGGMGGEEACNILREYDPDLLAIASSGYSTSNIMSDWESSGFNAVVPKPYRIKEMSSTLHSLLG
ncbi:MAG: response regulator [Coraliomargarita sp.]|nr:response regulator [Coraliomargarita sp.]